MNESNMLPTGNCYDDAVKHMLLLGHTLPQSDIYLVHAVCARSNGEQFSHAWVEIGGLAFTGRLLDGETICMVTPASDYRANSVLQSTSYEFDRARRLVLVTGNCGPWLRQYRSLCGKSTAVITKAAVLSHGEGTVA